MMVMDVRLRSLVLTALLVIMVASMVKFWPDQTTSTTAAIPAELNHHDKFNDSPIDSPKDKLVKHHFDRAVTQLRNGHYQQAIDGFRAVLEHSPSMPEAYINTGFAQIELQQFEQALASFQTAIELRPAQVNAYWGLAVSLEGLCDIPGAMGAMRTYLHLAAPDDPFMVKANAALWEWEQLKTAANNSNQGMHDCNQPGKQQGEP
jgi:tetratricopeptide (TPR) repeat protein